MVFPKWLAQHRSIKEIIKLAVDRRHIARSDFRRGVTIAKKRNIYAIIWIAGGKHRIISGHPASPKLDQSSPLTGCLIGELKYSINSLNNND